MGPRAERGGGALGPRTERGPIGIEELEPEHGGYACVAPDLDRCRVAGAGPGPLDVLEHTGVPTGEGDPQREAGAGILDGLGDDAVLDGPQPFTE